MAETYDAAVFGSCWARKMPPGHCCFEASTVPMCALYLIMAHLRAAMASVGGTPSMRRDATTSDAAAPRDEVFRIFFLRQRRQ